MCMSSDAEAFPVSCTAELTPTSHQALGARRRQGASAGRGAVGRQRRYRAGPGPHAACRLSCRSNSTTHSAACCIALGGKGAAAACLGSSPGGVANPAPGIVCQPADVQHNPRMGWHITHPAPLCCCFTWLLTQGIPDSHANENFAQWSAAASASGASAGILHCRAAAAQRGRVFRVRHCLPSPGSSHSPQRQPHRYSTVATGRRV